MAAARRGRCVQTHLAPPLMAAAVAVVVATACDGKLGEPEPIEPPSTGHWEVRASVPAPARFYVGVGSAGGKLFVVGGFGSSIEARAFHAYDPSTDTWEVLDPLPVNLMMANVAGIGGKLYILGALRVSDAYEYDVATRTLATRRRLPLEGGRGVASVGVWGNKILLAGGVLPGQSSNMLNTGVRQREFVAYDTTTDTWESLPDLPLPRGYSMSGVVGNEFWMAGGASNEVRTDQVDVFDLTARMWRPGPPLPEVLSSGGGAVVKGNLYVVGGIATSVAAVRSNVLAYDRTTNAWIQAAPLTVPRFAMGAAAIGDRIYVPAGLGMQMDLAASAALEVFVP